MLSEIQKNKIRAEEQYRHEVRHALEKQQAAKSSKNKVVGFLNTNLGLFLLSTVFISAFSWGYNKFEYSVQEKREKERNTKKLKIELVNRFRFVGKIARRYPGEERAMIRTAIFGLNGGNYNSLSPIPGYSPIYPEFKERSILSLLTELKETDNRKKAMDSIIEFSNKIPAYFWYTIELTGADSNYYDLSDSIRFIFLSEYSYYNQRIHDITTCE